MSRGRGVDRVVNDYGLRHAHRRRYNDFAVGAAVYAVLLLYT